MRGTTEAINLVAASWGRRERRPRRRDPGHRAGAPLEPRALADALRGARGDAARRADRRPRRGPPRRVRAAALAADAAASPSPTSRTPSARSTRCARWPRWPTRRRRSCWSTARRRCPHLAVDVQALGCDFYAFSGHKVYGPTGIGVLWGRAELLDAMPPWQGGGDMIRPVTLREDDLRAAAAPLRGRHAVIEGALGLAAALDYLGRARPPGRRGLGARAARAAPPSGSSAIPGAAARRHGARTRRPCSPSSLEGVHPHDVGTILDRQGIAVRAGHHCAQPLMERFGVPAPPAPPSASTTPLEEVDAPGRRPRTACGRSSADAA